MKCNLKFEIESLENGFVIIYIYSNLTEKYYFKTLEEIFSSIRKELLKDVHLS